MKILVMSNFLVMKWGILSINLNNVNLDNNFDEHDPNAIILFKYLAWHSIFKKSKALNKR